MIEIIVCIKQVIDPEAPTSTFKVNTETKRAIPSEGTPPVLNPFDENALEAALRLKDIQSTRITVISMGRLLAQRLLRKVLAVGADELVLLEDETFESFDSNFTAHILAHTIERKIGRYDIILCGRQSSDTDSGQVGHGIAEILGIPSVSIARKVEISERKLKVERVVSDGYEVIESPVPALITASNEIGDLRLPSVKALIEAQKTPITVYSKQDIEDDLSIAPLTKLSKLFIPIVKTNCQIIAGATSEESGANLAIKLREVKII